MMRVYLEKIIPKDKFIIFNEPDQLHHLKDVLRVKVGEKVAVFDNLGQEYMTRVCEIRSQDLKLGIIAKKTRQDMGLEITVACAIPKQVKFDDIVDKLTQLGVSVIIPLYTQRVIVRLDAERKISRTLRWEKIALSAAKQSQRNMLTLVKPVMDFKDALVAAQTFDLKLIPTLEGNRESLKVIFKKLDVKIKRVIVFIGPEGDFTLEEIAAAKAAGFLPITLGQQVLRVDTAAIAVVSYLKLNEVD